MPAREIGDRDEPARTARRPEDAASGAGRAAAPGKARPAGKERTSPRGTAATDPVEARIDYFRKGREEITRELESTVRIEHDENGKVDERKTMENIYRGMRDLLTYIRVSDDIHLYRDGVYVADPGMSKCKYYLHELARMIDFDGRILPSTERAVMARLKNEYDPDALTHDAFLTCCLPLNNIIIDLRPDARAKYCLAGPPEGIRKSRRIEATYDPDVLVAMQYKVDYDPDAKCPRFEAFLGSICENRTMRMRVLDMMAACLLPCKYDMNRFYILYGPGANGKSTLLDIIREMVGLGNCGSASMQKFDDRFSRFWGAHVYGKPCNLSDETGAERMESTANLRTITDHGVINVEEKYKAAKDYRPACTLVFCANELPYNPDRTDGFFRRLDLLELPRQFTDGDADDSVKTICRDPQELSGILNLLLPRAERIAETGDVEYRPTLAEMRERYTEMMSPIERYLKERTEECEAPLDDDKSRSYVKAVHDDYARWCVASKSQLRSIRSFNRLLRDMGYITSRYYHEDIGGNKSGKEYWTGLRLRDHPESSGGGEA